MLEISRPYLVYDYDITNCLKMQYVIDMRKALYGRDTRSFFYLHIESCNSENKSNYKKNGSWLGGSPK